MCPCNAFDDVIGDETSKEWFAQKDKDTWQTPPEIYRLIRKHQEIDLDPCAGPNTNIANENWWVGRGEDGLERDWYGTVFVNPPFSEKQKWVNKVINEIDNTDIIFLLTPDSTDVQSWWHDGIAAHANYVWFSRGRVGYVDPDCNEKRTQPTFGTAISIFGDISKALKQEFSQSGWLVEGVQLS